ncbi:MmgE/PrpD family protein [Halotalea alkalilenta]|uniref:MmgE/PrpD family protein n=1 Tax=Halotalea alkalilenta TaxID=376489 RepID=UPI000693707C|nr:MmgE/PrpD family protein [Halotalea alkalilenta]
MNTSRVYPPSPGVLTDALAFAIQRSSPSQASARAAARRGVADFIASALPVATALVPDSGLGPVREMFALDEPGHRAVVLGYLGHALDFDDYHPGMRGHPSTVVLSALLAAWKQHPGSSEELLSAYILGVEVAGRLGLAIGSRHYVAGFHSTATLGTIAAAAAVARLLRLDIERTAIALGLAATQAAGLRAQFGSAAKPLHAGLAARAGYESARLAALDFPANREVLPGFLDTLGLGAARPERLLADWGAPWRIVAPGLEFKRYPTCGGTHGAADAALALRVRLVEAYGTDDLDDLIEQVVVQFPPGADVAPFIRVPKNGVEARFSLEYVIAAALLEGEVALSRFVEGPVDARLAALAARVVREEDPAATPDALDPDARFHRIILRLTSKRELVEQVTRAEVVARPVDIDAKLTGTLDGPALDRLRHHLALRSDRDIAALLEFLIPNGSTP